MVALWSVHWTLGVLAVWSKIAEVLVWRKMVNAFLIHPTGKF